MTSKNDGGQAFPRQESDWRDIQDGMTLHDYFAGQVLASISEAQYLTHGREGVAAHCCAMADAMIKAREGSEG